ncbi:unnamed protein product [Closterium sp. NIES-65]|nr:unnamed protein product [Closterium sp. NIES-65]
MPPIPVIHTLPPLRYLLSRAAHISSRAHPLPVTPVAFPIPVTSSPSTSILVASPPSHIPSPSHRLPFCRLLPVALHIHRHSPPSPTPPCFPSPPRGLNPCSILARLLASFLIPRPSLPRGDSKVFPRSSLSPVLSSSRRPLLPPSLASASSDVPCAYPSLAPSSPHPHPTLTPPSPHPHPTLAPPPPHPHPTLASSFHSLSLPFFLLDPFTSPSLLSSLLFVPLTGVRTPTSLSTSNTLCLPSLHPPSAQWYTRLSQPLWGWGVQRGKAKTCLNPSASVPQPVGFSLLLPHPKGRARLSQSAVTTAFPFPLSLSPSPLPPLPFPLSASPSPLPPLRFPLSPSPSPLPPLPFPLSASPSPLPPLPHQYDSPLCLNLSGLLLFFLLLRGAHVSVAVLCRLAAILPRPEGLPPAAVRLCLNPHPTVLHGPGPLFENSKKPATRLPLLPYPEGPPLLPYPEGHPRLSRNTRCLPSLQPPPPQYYTLLCLNLPANLASPFSPLPPPTSALLFLTLRDVHASLAVAVQCRSATTTAFPLSPKQTTQPPLRFPPSQYYVPLCLNLSGLVLFFLTLRGVHVSVAVPVSNGATFAFNAAAAYAFGEKIQLYYVPLCLNLSGLVLFFLTLRGVHVSVAVPVSNGATFGFNAAAGYAFGEKIQPYYVPLCLNLSGSVLFFLTLRGVHVSVAVPVSNGATFAFNAAAGCAFGEKIQPALALGGVSLAVLGIALCV